MADSARTQRLAVMMADVVGSTALYETMGDDAARRLVGGCLARIGQTIVRHDGRTVKSLGDGILCTFASAERAALAAQAMVDDTASSGLMLRIAAHLGEVIEEGGDVFGDTVNTVARIAGLATAGEILVSRMFYEDLPLPRPGSARALAPVPVKGKRDPIEVVSLATKPRGALADYTVPVERVQPIVGASLLLTYAGIDFVVTADRPANLGRDPSNTITVDSPSASRLHARVHFEGGAFVLEDRSSNGTWIVPDGCASLCILRRNATLLGSGKIYLGADPKVAPSPAVAYRPM